MAAPLPQAYLASRELPNGDTLPALRIDGSTSLEDRCTRPPMLNRPLGRFMIVSDRISRRIWHSVRYTTNATDM